jgi:hypothetical protein
MNRTVMVHGRSHNAAHVFGVAYITGNSFYLTARVSELFQNTLQLFFPSPANENLCARPRVGGSQRSADASSASGYEGNLTCQRVSNFVSHWCNIIS